MDNLVQSPLKNHRLKLLWLEVWTILTGTDTVTQFTEDIALTTQIISDDRGG